MKNFKTIIATLLLTISTILLVACGQSTKDKLIGTWNGSQDSIIVLNQDGTAQVDGGSRAINGTWTLKDGYLYIDREEKADLRAKIPNGDFSSITVEKDPDSDSYKSSGWSPEIFTKK
ncbi:TPA: hypothetical protein ACGO8C_002053 [Streptococcus suis]